MKHHDRFKVYGKWGVDKFSCTVLIMKLIDWKFANIFNFFRSWVNYLHNEPNHWRGTWITQKFLKTKKLSKIPHNRLCPESLYHHPKPAWLCLTGFIMLYLAMYLFHSFQINDWKIHKIRTESTRRLIANLFKLWSKQ